VATLQAGRAPAIRRGAHLNPPIKGRDPLVAFIHVQRTGGSTLDGILRRQYGSSYAGVGNLKTYRATLDRIRKIGTSPDPGLRAIRGHMAFGVQEFLPPDTRYVTLLRDPVERVISHYHLLLHRDSPVQDFGLPPMPGRLTLKECVADGRYLLDNLQTRMLCDSSSPLGEVGFERLEEAKRNLRERFFVVGLTEQFDRSLVLLQSRLSLPRVSYRRRSVAPDRPAASKIGQTTIRLIEKRNALDLELYEVARDLFGVAVEAEGPEFEIDVAALERAQRDSAEQARTDEDPTSLLVDARARALRAELRLEEESERADRTDRLYQDTLRKMDRLIDRREKKASKKPGARRDPAP
jgi:hypothetical protein